MASSPPPPSAFLYQQAHGYTPTPGYTPTYSDYPTTHSSTSSTSTATATYTPTTKRTPPPPPAIPLPQPPSSRPSSRTSSSLPPTTPTSTTTTSPPTSPRPSLSLSVRSVRSTASSSSLLSPPPLTRRPKPAKPKALLLELESFPVPPTHIPPTPTPGGSGSGVNTPRESFQQQQQERVSLSSLSQAPSPSPASSGGATPYYTPAASPWSAHPSSQGHDQDGDQGEGGSGRRSSYGFEVEARATEGQRRRGAEWQREMGEAGESGEGEGQTLTLAHIPHTKTTPPTPTAAAIAAFTSSSTSTSSSAPLHSNPTTNEKTELSSSGSSFVSALSSLNHPASPSPRPRPRRSFDDSPSSPHTGTSALPSQSQRNPPPTAPPRAPLPPVPGPSRISDAFAEQVLLGGRSSMLSARSSVHSERSVRSVRSASGNSGNSGLEGTSGSGSSKSSRRRRRRRSKDEGREEGREEGGMERSSVYSTASGYSVASAYSAASGFSEMQPEDPFRNLGIGQVPGQQEKRPYSASLPALQEQMYHPEPQPSSPSHQNQHPPTHPHATQNQNQSQSPPRSYPSSSSRRSPGSTTPKSPRSPKSPVMPLSPLNPAVNLPLQQLVEDSTSSANASSSAGVRLEMDVEMEMENEMGLAPSLGRLGRLSASPLMHAAPLVGSEDTDVEDYGRGRTRSGSDGWGAASVEGSALGLSTAGLELEGVGPRLVDVRMDDMGMSVELESVVGSSIGVDRTPRKAGARRAHDEYPTHAGHRANESIATVGPPDFSAYADMDDSDAEGGEGEDVWRRYGEAAYGGIVPEAGGGVLFSAGGGSGSVERGEQDHDGDDDHVNYTATRSDGLSAPANLGLSEDNARRQHQQRDDANHNHRQVPSTHDHGRPVVHSASNSSLAATATTTTVDASSGQSDVDTAFRGFTFPAAAAAGSLSTPVKQQRDTTTPPLSSEPSRDDEFQQRLPPPRLITTAATPTPTRPVGDSSSSAAHSRDETPTQARRTLNGKTKTHMRGGPANESGVSSSSAGKSSVGSVGSFSLPSRHPHSPLHALLPRVEDQEAPNASASASTSASGSGGRRSGARDERRPEGVSSPKGVHSRLRSLSLSKSKEGAYAASAVFDATRPGMTSPTSIGSLGALGGGSGSASSSRPPPPGHAYPTTPSKRVHRAGEGSISGSNSSLVRPSFSTMTNLSTYTQHHSEASASEAEASTPISTSALSMSMSATSASASASASSSSRAASSSSTLHDTTEDDTYDDEDDDAYYYGAHPGEASLLDIDMGDLDDDTGVIAEVGQAQAKARRPGSAFGLGEDADEFGAFLDPGATTPAAAPSTTAMASAPRPLKQPQSVKDLRLELRAERTRSPALRRVYSQRSAAGLAAAASPSPELLGDGVYADGLDAYADADGVDADGEVVSVPAAVRSGVEGEGDSPPATASSGGTDVGTDPHMHATAPVMVSSSSSRVGLGLGFPSSRREKDGQSEMTMDEFGVVGSTRRAGVRASASSQATVSFDLNENEHDPRAPSPDIETILSASTSRRRKSSSKSVKRVVSDGAFVASPRSSSSFGSLGPRRQSEGVLRASANGNGSTVPRRAATQGDDAYDGYGGYGKEVVEDEDETLVGNALANLNHQRRSGGRDAGAGDGEDSDSSLDLHTPLPNLMVRDGLLSPHSKLLPGSSRAATPHGHVGPDERPGSTMSLVSSVTKSGVIKDERDTPMRRVRHRDGKLLAGGIGLTTGLGWSDSEDEDAPSPLTRRLSTLNLSRRSSASSVLPSSSSARKAPHHPLARSYSSGALLESDHRYHRFGALGEEDEEEEDEEDVDYGVVRKPSSASSSAMHGFPADEWGQRRPSGGVIPGANKSKTVQVKAPPTAWQGRKSTTSLGSRTSVASSSVGSRNSLATDDGGKTPSSSRMRLPSSGANSGAAAAAVAATSRLSSASSSRSTPYSGAHITTPLRRPSADDQLHTPSSTASTLSLPMPTTPKDTDSLASSPVTPAPTATGQKLVYNKNKSLPPLPAGGLKKTPSSTSARSAGSVVGVVNTASTSTVTPAAAAGSTKFAFPRARTFSATAAQSAGSGASPAAVRPLQLPRHAGARANGDRAAVPVPSIPSSSSSQQQSSTSRLGLRTPSLTSAQLSGPSTPLSPTSPPASPMLGHAAKPRTGTGMVYRSSSSKMRTAPLALSASASTSVAQGSGSIMPRAPGGSIGRAGGKAIPF